MIRNWQLGFLRTTVLFALKTIWHKKYFYAVRNYLLALSNSQTDIYTTVNIELFVMEGTTISDVMPCSVKFFWRNCLLSSGRHTRR
jgi:hypothetical protein